MGECTQCLARRYIMLLLTILVMIPCIQGFLITRAEPGVLVVAPGEKVTMSCAVDDHYEWCKWFHPGGQFCDFEWKRSQNNITNHSEDKYRGSNRGNTFHTRNHIYRRSQYS